MKSSYKHSIHKPSIAVIGLKGLPAFGGAATVGENLIGELHAQYCFTIFSVKSHAQSDYSLGDVKQVVLPGCIWKKINVLMYYIQAAIAVLFAKRGTFDIIHLHHTDAAFIAPFLRLRYKLILTSHARPQDGGKWSTFVKIFFRINERIAVHSANVFTTVSKSLRDLYKRKYNIDAQYIPNGVNAQLKDNGISSKTSEPYIFFSAGRIIPIKGLHLLIEALKKIDYKGSLKVAGNIDHLPEYKTQIMQQAQGLNIEFLGLIKDKAKLLAYAQGAQLFVMPSLTEAMSIMLLEVGLMKTPMLVSDIEAITNVFDDDEVLFFKSGDVNNLAEKLKLALAEKDMMHDLANKAFDKLMKRYQWKDIAWQYAHLYNSLLNSDNANKTTL